jgi:hypothetical protein
VTGPREFGRIEHDQAEFLAGSADNVQVVEDIGADKGDVGKPVKLGILAGQRQGRLGHIDTDHFAGAGLGRVQGEAAAVAKSVEHAPAGRQASHRPPIIALVQVEARLLALGNVDQETQNSRAYAARLAKFFDHDWLGRDFAQQRPILQLQALELADAALGAEEDAFGTRQLNEQLGQHLATLGNSQSGELNDEPTIVAIGRAAREAIAFAEDEPARFAWSIEPEDVPPQMNGAGQALAEKVSIEASIGGPAIEADADLALAVVKTAGHEIAGVRANIDLGAVRRLAFHIFNRARINPGMPAIERPGPPGLEDNAWQVHRRRVRRAVFQTAHSMQHLLAGSCRSERAVWKTAPQRSRASSCPGLLRVALDRFDVRQRPLEVARVLPAFQKGADAQQQVVLVNRLGDEIVRAGVHGPVDVARLVQGGDHDDADSTGGRVGPEALADFEAADLGHHDVEQDDVGPPVSDLGQRLLAVGGRLCLVTAVAEIRFE